MTKYPGSFFINEVGTRKELAQIYGVSERTIYRWLNKAAEESGLSPKVTKKRHPRPETLINFKGTRKALAKKYNVSERTAYRWLKKAREDGAEVPSRRRPSRYPGSEILTSDKTIKELSVEYDVSEQTISRWKRKARQEQASAQEEPQPATPQQPAKDIGEPWEVPEPEELEDIGEPWEVPEPEQPEDVGEPWEVPDYDYYEDDRPEWEKLGMPEDVYQNLDDIIRIVTENELLIENSAFNNLEHPKAIRYMQKYIRYQYEEVDPSLFYDADTHQERFDAEWISLLPIWKEEFETWLLQQMEIDEYEI